MRDWASDVAVYLQAESSLWLGDEPDWAAAAESLLPYRGRQAVLGTPSLSLGAYDELSGRIAERRGDVGAARRWWERARAQGAQVGSPHQVALAESHLTRVAPVPSRPDRQAVVAIPPSTGMTAPVT